MIFESLKIISGELDNYLYQKINQKIVRLANAATIESERNRNNSEVSLSLINIQEEFTLKNIPNHRINGTSVTYKNHKVYVNLYILFTVNKNSYEESLKILNEIISFFQGKKVFTHENTNLKGIDGVTDIKKFKFITEIYTPSFEELNHIWGTLGGKQYPSVLYKLSLLEIERDIINKEGPLIQEIPQNILHKSY